MNAVRKWIVSTYAQGLSVWIWALPLLLSMGCSKVNTKAVLPTLSVKLHQSSLTQTSGSPQLTLGFSPHAIGETTTLSVDVENQGDFGIAITGFRFQSGLHFSAKQTLKVPAHSDETLSVTFSPTAVGPLSDSMDILYTNNAAEFSLTLNLTGTGLPVSTFDCAAVSGAATKVPFANGSGTPADPYLICTSEQLNRIGSSNPYLSASFALGADLDLSNYNGSSPDLTFNPIGTYDYNAGSGTPFTGTFDGHSHTISHLTVDHSGIKLSAGLFGYTSGASLNNLSLASIAVTGNSLLSGLVGYAVNSSISRVSVTGTITSTNAFGQPNFMGAIAGRIDASGGTASITQSSANVHIVSGDCVGVISGFVSGTSGGHLYFSGLTASGTITTGFEGSSMGMLFGYIGYQDSGTTFSLSNVSASGSINSSAAFSGGFVGTLISGTGSTGSVSRAYSSADFTTDGGTFWAHGGMSGPGFGVLSADGASLTIDRVGITGNFSNTSAGGAWTSGGFAGLTSSVHSGSLSITNSYATGTISSTAGPTATGGFMGGGGGASSGGTYTVTNCYAGQTVAGQIISGFDGTADNITFSNNYWNSSLFANSYGVGTISGITGLTAAQLNQAANFVGFDFSNIWSIVEGSSSPTLR